MIKSPVTSARCATSGGGASEGGSGTTGAGGKGKGNGNGKGAAGGGSGAPTVQASGIPSAHGGPGGPGTAARCSARGFTATFRIHASTGMRSVTVFVDGKLLKRTSAKHFSVRVSVAGLRDGRNTIRVVAVDRNGRRRVASRSFRRCQTAAPSPSFTG